MTGGVWLPLDGDGPLYRQTYRALRRRILDGTLVPGTRLPATRELAATLGLSRNTIVAAYRELVEEGYAESRTGSGTRIVDHLPEGGTTAPRSAAVGRAAGVVPEPALSREAERMLTAAGPRPLSWALPRRSIPYDFRYGEPAYGDLPLETWQRMVGRRMRRASVRRLAYTPPGGSPELREALAGYLARSRGVECEAEDVIVTYGSQQALDLSCRVLLNEGDPVALEDPRYAGISLRVAAAGARAHSLPVDDAGMDPARLEAAGPFRLVALTPSHQFPTGAILPLERRTAILELAERWNAWVLEDDYDSEFRYDARPVECLQGLAPDRVVYTGSASKLLFPSLRIGWLVAPRSTRTAFTTAKVLSDTGSAGIEQLALADFIAQGALERHVRRMRTRNGQRRQALLHALADALGDTGRVSGADAGLHVLLELPDVPAARATELRQLCERRGVGLYPAAPYYDRAPASARFVLGYASLGEDEIRDGVERLAEAVRRLGAGR